MEVRVSDTLQTWKSMSSHRITHSLRFDKQTNQLIQSWNPITQRRLPLPKLFCSSGDFQSPLLKVGPASTDEDLILEAKSEEVEPLLNGACIYLVGMMGSGKTTVGKILSRSLGYQFYDCDHLIEEDAGGTSVADIFKLHGESFFRDNETEALRKLSSKHRLVISTGGGAVIRPVNWKHMHKGVSVWIDVPIETLAFRISEVGTKSRPLLHNESGNAYERALNRLSNLWKERGEAYTNASVHVSLEKLAENCGYKDVSQISPTLIAIEALVQIENFLKK